MSDRTGEADTSDLVGAPQGIDRDAFHQVLLPLVRSQPYPLLFATVSGAHLYGFPSPDSDDDLRGAHVLPVRDMLGLEETQDTIEVSGEREGVELDLVTHDVRKFLALLLKPNGYVLEQLYSPLVVLTSPEHMELKALARDCIARCHSRHYLGFAESQWKLFDKERPRRVKPLLYVFRVLLTGIYLLRTGTVEPNLRTLHQHFQLPYIDELIARKLAGPEQATLDEADVTIYAAEYARLQQLLQEASVASPLPAAPTGHEAINDFLIRLRLNWGI
jgi:hypothetical protein